MTKIKICGLTTIEDALFAAEAGADALGFVFVPSSPRYLEPAQALKIIKGLPLFVQTVGVFADSPLEELRGIAKDLGLDFIQLHGAESPDYCDQLGLRAIKAIRVKGPESLKVMGSYRVEAFLLDTYREGRPGGTGESFPWELALEAKKEGKIILSGGLNPGNVGQAINKVRPYGVDVSTGVEASPGQKDHEKVRKFIEEVRSADRC